MPFDVHPVIAVVQVRMTSSRLPGKVLKPLAGAPLIRRMIERVLRIDGIDGVAVALAEGAANDPVIDALSGMNVTIVRGSESDVLARSAAAARAAGAQTVMRITSDCPLLDPAVSAAILAAYKAGHSAGLRYARTSAESRFSARFRHRSVRRGCSLRSRSQGHRSLRTRTCHALYLAQARLLPGHNRGCETGSPALEDYGRHRG